MRGNRKTTQQLQERIWWKPKAPCEKTSRRLENFQFDQDTPAYVLICVETITSTLPNIAVAGAWMEVLVKIRGFINLSEDRSEFASLDWNSTSLCKGLFRATEVAFFIATIMFDVLDKRMVMSHYVEMKLRKKNKMRFKRGPFVFIPSRRHTSIYVIFLTNEKSLENHK